MNKGILALICMMIVSVMMVSAVTEVVTLQSPLNASGSTTDRRPTWKFIVTNPTNASVTCDLQVDSALQYNDLPVTNNTQKSIISSVALADGTHTWNVTCVGLGLSPETNSSATWKYPVGFNYASTEVSEVFVDNFVGIGAGLFGLVSLIGIVVLVRLWKGKKVL